MVTKQCVNCNRTRKHYAKGLCTSCYMTIRQKKKRGTYNKVFLGCTDEKLKQSARSVSRLIKMSKDTTGMCEICGDIGELKDGVCDSHKYPLM